jgi:signal transduction histidine kinase
MNLLYKTSAVRRKLWPIIAIIVLLLFLLTIFLSYIFNTSDITYKTMKYNSWYYKLGNRYSPQATTDALSLFDKEDSWEKLNEIGSSIINSKSNIVYYKTILPNIKVSDPNLLFQTNDQAFELYLDKVRIYSFGNFDTFDYKHSPGSPVHLISLPVDYQNKELIIAMKAVTEERLGIIRAFEVDSKSNHLITMLKMNILTLILGFLYILIGLVCILIGVAYLQGRKALFSLGFSFSIVGLWSISENSLTQLFYFKPDLWYHIAIISFYLIPVAVYMFIKDVSNSKNKALNMIIQLHLLLFGVSFILDLTGVLPFINSLVYHYILLIFSYTICVVIGIKSYLRGSIIALIYTMGFFIFGAFGIYDILSWYFELLPWKVNMAIWGMFIFQLSLLFAAIVHLKTLQDRYTLFKEKIKSKNSKLKEKEIKINQIIEYDKIKTEFFANVSHELRTPLNIINSTIQLIKMYNDKGMIRNNEMNIDKYVKIMSQNSNRLTKLVDNIIDMTKIESGYYKLEIKKVNVVSVVENVSMSIEEYVKNKGLSLIFDTDIEEKIISCDPDAIERIMLNMLSNAVKFSGKGEYIYVSIMDDVDRIIIEVKDTGIGIPNENINNVFERFVQVDKSFTRQNEGSGIGLAIVKSLIEMHKGSIELTSELNKGSKFTITLPVEIEGSRKIEEAAEREGIGSGEKVAIEFSDIYES